ncbi:hypothetical protein JW887_04025 [Candidatus Dojkabacteria bacterium]|nr:hypothetical protein [Candidatus Dojkabacteria bacterium]
MTFVAAKCPQCGGDLQLDPEKETVFCMHCGSKIVVRDAIKTVCIDNSHMIETWMEMGDFAAESGNNKEAYDYYTKVVEAQPNNWRAIFKRGKAAGWQSTLVNVRLMESATSFAKAIDLAPWENDERETIILDSAREITSLAGALIALRAERFKKWPDDDEADGFFNDINAINNAINVLTEKSGVQISGYLVSIASHIDSAISSAFYGTISSDYNGDDYHPGQFQFYQYLERIDRCINLLEKTIDLCEGDDGANFERYKQIVFLENKAIESCSWDYKIYAWGQDWHKELQLSNSAKQFRRANIASANKKIADISKKTRQKEIAESQEKERIAREEEAKQQELIRIVREIARRKEEEFWATHPEEKESRDKQRLEQKKLEEQARQEERLELERQDKIRLDELEQKRLKDKKSKTAKMIIAGSIVTAVVALLIVYVLVIPQNMINQAKENINQNQLSEALLIVNNLIARQPNNNKAIDVKVEIAKKYFDQNSYDESLTVINDILNSSHSNEAALDLKYKIALKYYEISQYTPAKSIFNEIQEYKDSSQQIFICNYQLALEFLDNNDYVSAINILQESTAYPEAQSLLLEIQYDYGKQLCNDNQNDNGINVLTNIKDYKDTEEIILNCRMTTLRNAKVNDMISFGTTSNGTPMRWKILDKQGSRLFLYAIGSVTEMGHIRVNNPDVTWSGSLIRTFLNSSFYNSTFNEAERKLILNTNVPTNMGEDTVDKIFLLSRSEILKYIPNENHRATTGFWLRDNGDAKHFFMTVWKSGYLGGSINEDGVIASIETGVLPAMWISLDNN